MNTNTPTPWHRPLLQGVLGFFIGIGIGQIISLIVVVAQDQSSITAPPPMLERLSFINELGALILQSFLCGVLGTVWALLAMMFNRIESPAQLPATTALHFLLGFGATFTVGYVCGWFPITLWAVIGTILSFVLVYAGIWTVMYLLARREVTRLNEALANR